MEARTRHEEADAQRAEAEAGVARVREIQARIVLLQHLNTIGVKASLDPTALGSMHITIEPIPAPLAVKADELLDEDEKAISQGDLEEIVAPEFGKGVTTMTLTKWLCSVGSRVERDQPIYEVSTALVDSEIPSPDDGVIYELLVEPGASFAPGTIIGRIMTDPLLDIGT